VPSVRAVLDAFEQVDGDALGLVPVPRGEPSTAPG